MTWACQSFLGNARCGIAEMSGSKDWDIPCPFREPNPDLPFTGIGQASQTCGAYMSIATEKNEYRAETVWLI